MVVWQLVVTACELRFTFQETVSDAIDRLDHGLAGGRFEFLPQVFHVRVDAAIDGRCASMQVIQELFAGEGLAGTAGK